MDVRLAVSPAHGLSLCLSPCEGEGGHFCVLQAHATQSHWCLEVQRHDMDEYAPLRFSVQRPGRSDPIAKNSQLSMSAPSADGVKDYGEHSRFAGSVRSEDLRWSRTWAFWVEVSVEDRALGCMDRWLFAWSGMRRAYAGSTSSVSNIYWCCISAVRPDGLLSLRTANRQSLLGTIRNRRHS